MSENETRSVADRVRDGIAEFYKSADPALSVDIPLPPEPPRDRVIEAVDADGEVADQFTWSRRGWRGLGYAAVRPWYGVVWVAMQSGWSLWSVPAEGGDES